MRDIRVYIFKRVETSPNRPLKNQEGEDIDIDARIYIFKNIGRALSFE